MILAALHRLASPPTFYRVADRLLPWCAGAWLMTFVLGAYWGLVIAPADYQQGDAYRIIYVHVPAAWMSLFVYTLITAVALVGWVWKFKLAGVFVAGAAPLGAAFTALTLFTGAVWGKPMWGAWWVWDARLTSELILLFLYLGYIALANAISEQRAREQAGTIFLLVGFVNIPIIHFSVEWWSTLHQPAGILKWGAPSVHPSMLKPLLCMVISFNLFFATAVLLAMQTALLKRGGAWTREAGKT